MPKDRKLTNLEKALGALLLGEATITTGLTKKALTTAVGLSARNAIPAARSLGLLNPVPWGIGAGLTYLDRPEGQALLSDARERGRTDRLRIERIMQDLEYGTQEKLKRSAKKRVTNFNKAVSKGLKKVKESKAYGRKGVINNSKKAFSAVTKAVSARSKGKPAPKSLAGKIAYNAAKTVYTDEILRRKKK